MLLRCFGDGADAAAAVVYVDRKANTLNTHLLNMPPMEASSVLHIVLPRVDEAVQGMLADDGVHQEPPTVQ